MGRIEQGHDFEGLKENLLKNGQEKYSEFQGTVYNERVAENFGRLKKDVDQTLSREEEKKIDRFLVAPEKEPEIGAVLDRQNTDLAGLLKGQEDKKSRIKLIGTIKHKDKSFAEVVKEQEEQGISFTGFENDADFADLDGILKKVFSDGLIDKALISKIIYQPDVVYVDIKGRHFYLPVEKYDDWKRQAPEVQQFKFRAGNFSSWNKSLDLTPEYMSFSIDVFSFHDEDLGSFDYLRDLPEEKKMRFYKLGTIFHEVGHNLYFNLMGASDRERWKDLIDQHGSLTYYSEKHAKVYGGILNYGEEFAEAIRLLTTAPDYLQQRFLKVYDFLKEKFPEIRDIKYES